MTMDYLQVNRATLDIMMEGCQIVDFDERYLYLNKAAEKQIKTPSSQLIGLKYTEAWPGIENSLIYKRLKKCLIDRTAEQISGFFEFNKSSSGFYEINFLPVSEGVLVTSIEISENLQKIESLRESEKNYRLLVENQTDLVVKVDKEGRFLFVSPSYCKMFGKQAHELLGKKFTPLVHKDDVQKTLDKMKELEVPPHTAYIEQRALTTNGWTWLAWLDTAVIDDIGEIKEIIGVGRDISIQHEAEEALRSSSRRLITLMGNLPGMAYRCVNDTNWTMEFISQGAEKLTGYSANQMVNNSEISYGKLINWHDREMVWDKVQAAIVKNEQYVIEYRITDKSGREKYVWEQGRKVETDDRGNAILEGFIMDITDRRTAENELRELKNNLEVEISEKSIELQARVKELERFYEATIDREFRIKELRQEIEELKKR